VLVGSIAVATFLSVAAHSSHHPVTAANVFIVIVLINGSVGGLTQGLASAVIVSVIYDFFIRYPVYERGFDAIDDFLPIVALTITAFVSGAVSGQLRSQVASAERARTRLGKLLGFSSRLQLAVNIEEIAHELVGAVSDRATLHHCLDSLRVEHAFRDIERWERAIDEQLRTSRTDEDELETAADIVQAMDERAIISLTAMAIERCELLEEQAAAEAAIRSERLKSALLSSLSHDLRTPLAAISASASNLDRLGATLDEDGRRLAIDTIQQQCDRLVNFTTQLMSLGRLEGGLSRDELEVVDLEEAIGGAIAAVRPGARGRQIIRQIDPGHFFTRASPILLQQVLCNLLDNALRYSPDDLPVTLTLTREGHRAVIAVRDEGPGIAPGERSRIFERFYRGASATGRAGHGLGLSIVRAFADAIGGDIQLLSPAANGHGTEMRIILPCIDIAIEELEVVHG